MQPFDSDATDQVVDFIVLSRLRLSALYIHRSMSKQIKTEILYIDSPKKQNSSFPRKIVAISVGRLQSVPVHGIILSVSIDDDGMSQSANDTERSFVRA